MNIPKKRRGLIAVCVFGTMLTLAMWQSIGSHNQRPKNVTCVLISNGQRLDFYHRDFNKLVRGGRLLWQLERLLGRIGVKTDFVQLKTLVEESDRVCVVMGVDGEFPDSDEVGASILTGSEQIPLTMNRQTVVSTTQLVIFCKSAPLAVVPKNGIFEVTNSSSGAKLVTVKF